jgi:hypothetical protein
VLHLLLERIDHDGETDEITLTFRPMGLSSLAATIEEAAA